MDCELQKWFPGTFMIVEQSDESRDQIVERGNDEVIFDDNAGYALLQDLSLDGKIDSISL